jgi:hypothetical protein
VRIATTFLVLVSLTAPATASELISFEEIPAQNSNRVTLSEEYAHLGVHFSSLDDGAIWDGMSTNGELNSWELDGTNGPAFIGFNGRSYKLTARFDAPVPAFHVDVAAASGATPGGTFALQGYLAGALVETTSVTLGGVNQWQTVALTAEVDQVILVGQTGSSRYFGADNLGWGGIDAPTRVDAVIDVRPDSSENPVNPGSNGVLPVALLGSETFDVMDVDPDSLALGVNAAPAVAMEYADANGDGWIDLVAHYHTPETGTAYGDTSICLTGAMMDGIELAGCDTIRTVPQSPAAQKARQR